ncbi:outer membrane transport energization protein ExbD [Salinihabitans flavidus]|uniref:Outer membrane transport energization protein ExbD n=1 Tax=Salinihabitans flavidus TaxID=569882 RepID=A0A1H8W2E9_9RHOB|nr:outer membrane transport energization protein ExbD [Salinihabitans flavidus]
MTSLIDVIFLLLLFFMLSSTFTRFAEVELAAAGGGAGTSETRPVYLSLGMQTLRLNGEEHALDDVAVTLNETKFEGDGLPVIVALRAEVTAQRLTDLLAVLRGVPDITVTVLEAT